MKQPRAVACELRLQGQRLIGKRRRRAQQIHQLHRAIGESHVFLNYAVWESVAHFKAAFSHPDFRAALGAYPSSVVASPHLFERIAVPNLCTR